MIEKFKTYAKITDFGSIARRYFVNNFYDGMLTIIGILLGFFILIFKEGQQTVDSHIVLLTGFATAISMFMSGLSGSYISEKAEQKRLKTDLDKAMVIIKDAGEEEKEDKLLDNKEIEKAMLTVNFNDQNRIKNQNLKKSNKKRKKAKTLVEKAERFASIIVALVNGCAPLLGGTVPLIPFFFTLKATFSFFIYSFLIVFICIVLLGIFVGFISRESIWKNALQMLGAFGLTIIVSILVLD
ncbi:MAG: VIT1/CCC1 transporter family protein [Promethearchaeota archaeon]